MFGRMNAEPMFRLDGNGGDRNTSEVELAVAKLLEWTEKPEIARWIQFPTAVLLLLLVPGDPESGALYVYDRRKKVVYWVDFADQNYGGYSLEDLSVLVDQCGFMRFLERPFLLKYQWLVQPGSDPRPC